MSVISNFIKQTLIKIKGGAGYLLLELLLPSVAILLVYLCNFLLFPLARIPSGNEVTYKLKVKLKAIHIACPYRDIAEEIMGNRLLFFSKKQHIDAPSYLYVAKKSLNNLPMDLVAFNGFEKSQTQEETLVLEVSTRKSLICGYLPAKILSYEVISEKPDFAK